MSSLLSRFQGSLVGAVTGDCIGAVFERLWARTIEPEKVKKVVDKIDTGECFGFLDDTNYFIFL